MFTALVAVSIGATVLSGLITVYIDIPRQMGQEFRSYGANLILLPAGDGRELFAEDVEKAHSLFPAGSLVGLAPYRYRMAKINEQPFMAAGTDLGEVKKTSPYWFVSGKWPEQDGDVLVGKETAGTIRLLPGSVFTLTGTNAQGESFSHDFTVTGIIETGGPEEAFVIMSLADFESAIGLGGFDAAECSLALSEEALNVTVGTIGDNLPEVTPRLVRQVARSEGAVLGKLQALVYLVTVIVLMLTMICVATTMMAVVAERRREIGLKKAIGAANREIVGEFLGEGIFLGAAGGIFGSVFGIMFAQSVSMNVFKRAVAFQPLLLPLTVAVSVAVTALACLIPVRQSVDVDPAIVLRGE
jgi:putative ABC transport system permease protein